MRYKLPVGTKVTRRISPDDARSDYGYDTWVEFVTTKNAYYTSKDITESTAWRVTFFIPPTVHGSTVFDRIETNWTSLLRISEG